MAMDFLNAGASAVGALLGYNSQSEANAINQHNFAMQMQMARDQFKSTQAYNSEQAQVRRLRAAGLNPALAGLGNSSSSVGSVPSANPYQPFDFSPFAAQLGQSRLVASEVDKNSAAASLADNQSGLVQNQSFSQFIKNAFESERQIKEIEGLDIDNRYKSKLLDIAELQRQFDSRTLRERIDTISADLDYKRALRDSVTISNRYLPSQLQASINKTIAEETAAYCSGKASLQQAHAAIMSATNQQHAFDAQFGATKEDRQQFFNKTLQFLVQQKKTSESQEWRNYILEGRTSIGYGIGEAGSTWFTDGRESKAPDYNTIIPSGMQHSHKKKTN